MNNHEILSIVNAEAKTERLTGGTHRSLSLSARCIIANCRSS